MSHIAEPPVTTTPSSLSLSPPRLKTRRPTSSLLVFPLEHLHGLLAHDKLLHLAGDGHGEGVDKENVGRDLEVGQLKQKK